MSGSKKAQGSGLLPKLLLWGLVLLFGVLYLSSINEKRGEDEADGHAAEAVPAADNASVGEASRDRISVGGEPEAAGMTSAPETAAANRVPPASGAASSVVAGPSSSGQEAAPAPVPEAGPGGGAAPLVVEKPPVQSADTAPGQARRLSRMENGGERAEDIAPGGKRAEPPEAQPAEQPGIRASLSAPREPAAVTPAEAEAFAKAVMSEPESAATARAPQPAAAPAQASDTPVPEAVPAETARAPAPAAATEPQESAAQARARIMAEYEAMRQRAHEEKRRRWGQPSAQGQYPAFPGYMPGYYPPRQP
jgi:hypothetical protein